MKNKLGFRSWIILSILALLACALFLLSALVTMPNEIHALVESVAEAMTVSIVVALVVEPRLLRHFGEELASQTFWASFYSKAPREFRDAVQELAAATQFALAVNWKVTFDWADDDQTIIRFRSEITNYRENRDIKSFQLVPRGFIYESPFPSHRAVVERYIVICEGATFCGSPLHDGFSRIDGEKDGRVVINAVDTSASAYFEVPAGLRYTLIIDATSYAREQGYAPLVITTPTLSLTVELRGSALPDLWLSIIHPGSAGRDSGISGDGSTLRDKGRIPVGEVSLSGQTILLSWARQPREITAVEG